LADWKDARGKLYRVVDARWDGSEGKRCYNGGIPQYHIVRQFLGHFRWKSSDATIVVCSSRQMSGPEESTSNKSPLSSTMISRRN
jgi:hypothetical protein